MQNEESICLIDTLGTQGCVDVFSSIILPRLSHQERVNFRRVSRLFNDIYKDFMKSEGFLGLNKEISFHTFVAKFITSPHYNSPMGGREVIIDALQFKPAIFMAHLKQFFGLHAGAEAAADIDLIFDVLTQFFKVNPVPERFLQTFPNFKNRVAAFDEGRPSPTFDALGNTLLNRLNPVQMQRFIVFFQALLSEETIGKLEATLKDFEAQVKRFCPKALTPRSAAPAAADNALPAFAPDLGMVAAIDRQGAIEASCCAQFWANMQSTSLGGTLLLTFLLGYGASNLFGGTPSKDELAKGLPTFTIGLMILLGYIIYNIAASCYGWKRHKQLSAIMRLRGPDPERAPLLPI